MPRYTRSQGTKSRSVRSRQVRVASPLQPANQNSYKSIWKNPLVWIGSVGAIAILFLPIWQDSKIIKVISAYAIDVSDSGIANPEAVKAVCKARVERLIAGDVSIMIEFSDRAEKTGSQTIDNNTDLNQSCQTVFTNGKERSRQISKLGGRSRIRSACPKRLPW